MKTKILVAVAVLALALSATSVLASSSKDILVREGTVVGGKTLSDGEYELKWTGTGDNVQVMIQRGSRVYKATGSIETRPEAKTNDAVLYEKTGDDTWRIKEIQFAGKKEVLVLKG